jgi:hypothetical protein
MAQEKLWQRKTDFGKSAFFRFSLPLKFTANQFTAVSSN